MNFRSTIQHLQIKLREPLPGIDAQSKMASNSRIKWIRDQIDDSSARESAVLLLLYPDNDITRLVFILRPEYDGVHSGQVGFPGGRYEEEDHSFLETALREANEEIGIDKSEVNIIGGLSKLYIPPSNFNVYPYIGYVETKPEFIPDKTEVARILEIDLKDLLNNRNKSTKIIQTKYGTFEAPCFDVEDVYIWGGYCYDCQ
jgi:8-oxo-dGTP pyrophosphatase MutT (NUDIX family)